eukprot:TRINITY_DN727_c0_g1_i11.p1 TRINITY_DN727_c0_g1~~TRINITY_DN727_c0_g1_i11.p1  ORF type:complete len:305 (-),score=164.93 TRINITY_DN727_c0_g1_i11:62-976(-)
MTTDTTRAKYYKRLGLRPPPTSSSPSSPNPSSPLAPTPTTTPVLLFGNPTPLLRNPLSSQPFNNAVNIAANYNGSGSSFSSSEAFDPAYFRKQQNAMSPSPSSRSTSPSPSSSLEPFYSPSSSSLFNVPSSSPSTANNSPSTTPSSSSSLAINILSTHHLLNQSHNQTSNNNNSNNGLLGEENLCGILIDSSPQQRGSSSNTSSGEYDKRAFFFGSLPTSGSPALYSVPIEIPSGLDEDKPKNGNKSDSGSEADTSGTSLKTSKTFSPPHEYIKHLRKQMDSGDLSQSYFERPSKKYNVFSNYT